MEEQAFSRGFLLLLQTCSLFPPNKASQFVGLGRRVEIMQLADKKANKNEPSYLLDLFKAGFLLNCIERRLFVYHLFNMGRLFKYSYCFCIVLNETAVGRTAWVLFHPAEQSISACVVTSARWILPPPSNQSNYPNKYPIFMQWYKILFSIGILCTLWEHKIFGKNDSTVSLHINNYYVQTYTSNDKIIM